MESKRKNTSIKKEHRGGHYNGTFLFIYDCGSAYISAMVINMRDFFKIIFHYFLVSRTYYRYNAALIGAIS